MSIESAGAVSVLLGFELDEGRALELAILVLQHSYSNRVESLAAEDIAHLLLFGREAKVAHEDGALVGVAAACLTLLGVASAAGATVAVSVAAVSSSLLAIASVAAS
jgi:hypothetical protein